MDNSKIWNNDYLAGEKLNNNNEGNKELQVFLLKISKD